MTHLGLFEGIGGFSLAARWMGWTTLAWCEWNEFGQRILRHHFPEAEGFGDITKTDFKKYHGKIDILTGGFPCQPYSAAGKRRGKDDERHLWPHMLRAVREVRPRYVVGENVLGLVNWSDGLVFEEVHADLEAEGYEVLAFVLPAAAVGAPHRRDRVWFVAHAKSEGTGQQSAANKGGTNRRPDDDGKVQHVAHARGERHGGRNIRPAANFAEERQVDPYQQQHGDGVWRQTAGRRPDATHAHRDGRERGDGAHGQLPGEGGLDALGHLEPRAGDGHTTHADDPRLEGLGQSGGSDTAGRQAPDRPVEQPARPDGRALPATPWDHFPTQSPICGGDDGLPTELDGISFSKWRTESVKAYGNAIVPQVALQLFRAIELTENQLYQP